MTQQPPKSQTEWSELIRQALTVWAAGAEEATRLESLSIVQARLPGTDLHSAVDSVLEEALARLEARSERYAEVIRLRFRDNESARSIANRLSLAESSVYRNQREALDALTETIKEMESSARGTLVARFEARLEAPTYFDLIGIEPHLQMLGDRLLSDDGPWIVAIEGMGGAGKTALADALMRRLIRETNFHDFAWVTARQGARLGIGPTGQELSTDDLILSLVKQLWGDVPSAPSSPSDALHALEYRLKTQPHIVVIDNLETVADVEVLLPTLRRLARPSKFLLTSRESLFIERDIFHFPLPPLSLEDSIHLVRQEAKSENLTDIYQLPDEDLAPIYDVVGGNPLALLLVVGQCHFRQLSDVLADFVEARGYRTEQLYTYIYWRIWAVLDETSRNVLMAMQLVPIRGEDEAFLLGVTDLSREALLNGIEKLMTLNLVECTRDRESFRYSIHSLTRSFLHQQAVKWLIESRA